MSDLLAKSLRYSATTTQLFDDFIVLDKGGGCWILASLEDGPARLFLDFTASIGVNVLGYGNSHLQDALHAQIDRGVIHFSDNDWRTAAATELKEKLVGLTPGDFPKKVFLANSGTEAVEAAIKLVLAARPAGRGFLCFEGGFHGRTGYSLSLTSSKPVQTKGFPQGVPLVFCLSFPDRDAPGYRFAKYQGAVLPFLDHLVSTWPIRAFVFELIQGEGGIRVADPEAINFLVRFLRERGVLLVADEIQTGIGRTGKLFACEHYELVPDIITLAKALGGGLPIGATIFRADLDFDQPGRHSNTFGGNTLAVTAASTVLDIVSQESFLARVQELGALLAQRLSQLTEELSGGGIRLRPGGIGLMQRLDFRDRGGKPLPNLRDKITRRALEKGLLVLPAGAAAIRFMPPLAISRDELLLGLALFREAATEVMRE